MDAGQEHPDPGPAGREWVVTRRDLLRLSACSAAGALIAQLSRAAPGPGRTGRSVVRFGMVTDCHYADVGARGSRYYRESLAKLGECVELMNSRKVDFLIELGDFKDQDARPIQEKTIAYLRAVERVFGRFAGPRYHVLGNHDADSISKEQFLANVENSRIERHRKYYSFDSAGLHFTVLDANYRADGADYDHGDFDWTDANIPPAELEWLEADLAAARGPAVVFTHQLLDGEGKHHVKNASQVRRVLESAGKVAAVFQGHLHKGSYSRINGVHYYTLRAVVEGAGRQNNSYAVVEVLGGGDLVVTGYRRAAGMSLPGRPVSRARASRAGAAAS